STRIADTVVLGGFTGGELPVLDRLFAGESGDAGERVVMVSHQLLRAPFVGDLNEDQAAGAEHGGDGFDHERGVHHVFENVLAGDDVKLAQAFPNGGLADIGFTIVAGNAELFQTKPAHARAFGIDFHAGDVDTLFGQGDHHAAVAAAN